MQVISKSKYRGARTEPLAPFKNTPGGTRMERKTRRGANRNSDNQGKGCKTEKKGVAPARVLSGRQGSPCAKTRAGR